MGEDLFARVCRMIADSAGEGWDRASYRATIHPYGGISARMTVEANGRESSGHEILTQELREALHDRLGDAAVELVIHADGTFTAVAVTELHQITSYWPPTYRRVLDPDFRPTERVLPASALPPAGDPARVPALVAEFTDLVESITGSRPDTHPPATDAALTAAEHRLGVTLPADLRALYRLSDGDRTDAGPLGLRMIPLDEVAGTRDSLAGRDRAANPLDWSTKPAYRGPSDTVRTGWWHAGWVPIGTDDAGRYLVVDLAPGPTGHPGQVVSIDHEDDLLELVAPSVTECLAQIVARLRTGEYTNPSRLYFPTRRPPKITLHASLATDDLAAVLARVAEPERLREVHLRDAGGVDLTPLTTLPALEHVDVTAPDLDLSPLADLPLRSLRVAGGAVVDVPAWPDLVELDLGGATAADPEALPHAPLLTLHADQWRDLATPPKGLAVAGLAGRTSLAHAAEWAAWLGAPVPTTTVDGRC